MATQPGSQERPLRVAIIGAGPSGFYATQALLAQADLNLAVDIIDHLPAPYGLVRYGVAPDHQKIKSVTKVYDRIAEDPRVRFLGNVTLGRDLTHDDLRAHYEQVVYAVGAQTDRRLGVPGEDLVGSYPATDFVAWFNGHPDYAHLTFDLSCESVAVVGVGNVAMDVARILALSPAELEASDIADYALEALRKSQVRNIYVIARRGPAQVKFTNPELRELAELEETDVIIDPAQLELDAASEASIADNRESQQNLDIMRHYAGIGETGKPKNIYFLFMRSPVELSGDDDGRVTRMKLEKNILRSGNGGSLNAVGPGDYETIDVGLVMRSIGYKGEPLSGVPFNSRAGVIPNVGGRVVTADGQVVPGEYVVGWIKRGPTGIIGTNKPDAVATVRLMLEDIPGLASVADDKSRPESVSALLNERGVRFVTWEEWKLIDQTEVAAGEKLGRPRVKLTTVPAMLAAIDQAKEALIQDVLIVGGGPAGLYAAFYAGLRGLKARVLETMPVVGGQLSALYPEMDIYDAPGFSKIGAMDLVEALRMQAERFGKQVDIRTGTRVVSLDRDENGLFVVKVDKGETHRTRKLILATGLGALVPVRLDIPSLNKYEGRGVYYFARDRAVLRGKSVVVVGGGDSAVLWALNLKDWAARVTLIHRRDRFRAREGNVAELMSSGAVAGASGGVDVRLFHEVKEVKGKTRVEAVVLVDNRTHDEFEIPADALLLALGYRAERRIVESLGIAPDENGIKVDGVMQTNVEGVYAIGDVAKVAGSVSLKLIATGLGEAAIAANHACHALRPDKPIIPHHSSSMRL